MSKTPSGDRPRTPSNGAGGKLLGERFVPGTVLADRYRIGGLLGRGGMGEVYRADDLSWSSRSRSSSCPTAVDGDAERLGRFYREVRIARQVSHPAVCRVYDIGEAEGHAFLSMELRGRRGPRLAAAAASAGCPPTRRSRSRASCAPAWPPHMPRACSTAT